MSATTSAICPGQSAMFTDSPSHRCLRVVFGVEWMGAPPSFEQFFMADGEIELTLTAIGLLEGAVAALLERAYGEHRVVKATYLAFSGWELDPSEITELDWRMLGEES